MPRRPSSGGRVPWLLIGLLLVVGAATVVGRELRVAPGLEPRATPAAGPTRALSRPAPTRPAVAVTEATATASPVPSPAPVRGVVELTFDAGADRGYTEDILELLAEQHARASFGITGQWARANADLVRRMAAEGHQVFNHTLDHRSFTGLSDHLGGLSPTRRRAELDDADAIIAPLIGSSTRPFYRLPYGDDDARVASDVASSGYTRKVGWTIDSLGWRGLPAGDIVARCLKLVTGGAVYVFHVGRASQDAAALPQIIRGLREQGFAFRRVDQK